NPGANDSGAHVVPPSVEYEMPQPSFACQSFHIPIKSCPLGSMPSDSSFAANWSSVMRTGDVTVAAPASDTAASAQNTANATRPSLLTFLSSRSGRPRLSTCRADRHRGGAGQNPPGRSASSDARATLEMVADVESALPSPEDIASRAVQWLLRGGTWQALARE